MIDALSIDISDVYRILDFDKQQADSLLKRLGVQGKVPSWLPSRPLLISYFASNFASKDLFRDRGASISSLSAGQGWRSLIPFLAERETRLDSRQVPSTVEKIYGALGSLSRLTPDGLGLFTVNDFDSIFRNITGAAPDEDAMQMMLRLAGTEQLGDGSAFRRFIDHDLADAMRFIEVQDFIASSYRVSDYLGIVIQKGCESPIRQTYIDVFRSVIEDGLTSKQQIIAAYEGALGKDYGWLASEIVVGATDLFSDYSRDVKIAGIEVDNFEIDVDKFSIPIVMKECIIGRLQVDGYPENYKKIRLSDCLVTRCILSNKRLAGGLFDSTNVVGDIEDMQLTTSALIGGEADRRTGVLLTVLKKLFLQSGSGRQRGAFYRGLDQAERVWVDPWLEKLKSLDYFTVIKAGGNEILVPDRSKLGRVGRIMARPRKRTDPLLDLD